MQDCIELDILSVTTTVGTLEQAQALARELVERRLAACVQLEPGQQSLYRWQGEVCDDPEVRLVIKTLPGCETALQALFKSHHPYELPQFLCSRMTASMGYAEWVRTEVVVPNSSIS